VEGLDSQLEHQRRANHGQDLALDQAFVVVVGVVVVGADKGSTCKGQYFQARTPVAREQERKLDQERRIPVVPRFQRVALVEVKAR